MPVQQIAQNNIGNHQQPMANQQPLAGVVSQQIPASVGDSHKQQLSSGPQPAQKLGERPSFENSESLKPLNASVNNLAGDKVEI